MDVIQELEERVRARGVRVEERLRILRALADAQQEQEQSLEAQLEAHERAIREAARRVRAVTR